VTPQKAVSDAVSVPHAHSTACEAGSPVFFNCDEKAGQRRLKVLLRTHTEWNDRPMDLPCIEDQVLGCSK
jgi:hypothetical protein